MGIVIDSREPNDTYAHLSLLADELSVDFLDYGDLRWPEHGVELKSVTDLIHSLWSKDQGERLETQLDGLRKVVDHAILGIHGIWWSVGSGLRLAGPVRVTKDGEAVYARFVADTRITLRMISAFLWSVQNPQEGNNIVVLWQPTKEMLLEQIAAIYYNSRKSVHTTFSRRRRAPSTGDVYLDVLCAVPGLGEYRAKALLTRFGTVRAVSSASDKELEEVKGIGKDSITKLRAAFD